MIDVVDVLRKRVVCSDYRKDKKSCGDQCDCVEIERAALLIERLRKALEYYAKTWPLELDANDWTYVHGCKEWGVVARSALGEEFQ